MKPSPEVLVVPLESRHIEEAARLFHGTWHETQARFQDPRVARYRDLAFFCHRVAERQPRTRIAKIDGHCVGLTVWTGNKLNSLFVDGAFRDRGIGSLLCAEAERQMALGGFESFWLDCLEGNHAARRFYETRDWRVECRHVLESETPEGLCRCTAWKMVKP